MTSHTAGAAWLSASLAPALAGLVLIAQPAPAEAWPAIQDPAGVHACESPPFQMSDGRWGCRSAGVARVGLPVEVSGGPYGPGPGSPPPGYPPGPPPVAPYWGGPWGPPPDRTFGGYDELDPWLGRRGPPER